MNNQNVSPTRDQSPDANPTHQEDVNVATSPQKDHVYITDQQSDMKWDKLEKKVKSSKGEHPSILARGS